ncbi:MAG: 23S rRNA (guanosine(2251)-2'-O)-methyltransferase RlmB, partial [Candidatus Dormibacterales bacterium]
PRPELRPRRGAPAQEAGRPLIHGRNAVLAAARAGRVLRVLMAPGLAPDPRLDEIRRLARVDQAPAGVLDALTEGVHQGVAAEVRPHRLIGLDELLRLGPTLLVALDSVQDPHNLGAILRSAEAAGAGGAILPARRTAPVGGAAVKAGSGATELLPLCQVPGLPSAIGALKRAGFWCVALDPGGEALPWEVDLTGPLCLVVGGEGTGVHRLVRERCDARVRLPMAGRLESLNASAAAAAVLFEAVRQRGPG